MSAKDDIITGINLLDIYDIMPDLKIVCKPCPNMIDSLKPRKIINRLPDLDMWLVCEDGSIEQAQAEYGNMMTRHITLFMIIFQLLQHLILQKE